MRNLSGHNTIINTLSVNKDNVAISGGDNGSMYMWDWKTGYNFQQIQVAAQPGSLDSEAGIFASSFDRTGSRLITCEADKTVKIWEEDLTATPESHPIDYTPPTKRARY
jgi:pleiotropic regulator 1